MKKLLLSLFLLFGCVKADDEQVENQGASEIVSLISRRFTITSISKCQDGVCSLDQESTDAVLNSFKEAGWKIWDVYGDSAADRPVNFVLYKD